MVTLVIKICGAERHWAFLRPALPPVQGTSWNGVRRDIGGASRDRTDDLFHAMEALSQLSYGPTRRRGKLRTP